MGDPFSVGASAIGVISLGLTVCSGLLEYYDSWRGQKEDVKAMYSSLEGLTKTFKLIESTIKDKSFTKDVVQRVEESIQSCESAVQALEKKLSKMPVSPPKTFKDEMRAQVKRATYPFKESTLAKLREIISDLRENLSLAIDALQIDISASSLRLSKDMDGKLTLLIDSSQIVAAQITKGIADVKFVQGEQESRAANQENLSIIEWLSPLNFVARQNEFFGRRQGETGRWLLRNHQFEQWLNGSVGALWCPGIPGAGKTVLASVVVNHLQETFRNADVGIAYIYCVYNAIDQTTTNFISSLLQQLVRLRPQLDDDIKKLYEHHTKFKTRPSLPEHFRLLEALVQRLSKVFIVVDALDECPEQERESLLKHLQSLLPDIQLFATSRHVASIEHAFSNAAKVEIRADDEDLIAYLSAQIDVQPLLKKLIGNDAIFLKEIKDIIVTKAGGMFLLAELHIGSLSKKDNKRALRNALKNLPAEINKTYDETMIRIKNQDPDKVERANQVLSWINFAERPLTLQELKCALAIEPEDEDLDEDAFPDEHSLLSVCCGLVTIEAKSQIVRFVHYTTEEYFERIRDKKYPKAQEIICQTCLTYLSFRYFEEELWTVEEYENLYWGWDAKSNTKLALPQNALLIYAAQNWANHARKAWEQSFSVHQAVDRFLQASKCLDHCVQIEFQLHSRTMYHSDFSFLRDFSELHIASAFGLTHYAESLIRQNLYVDRRDSAGRTPLHYAARRGHEDMARLLLDSGADIAKKDRGGRTALDWAAREGKEPIVYLLLEHGAKTKNDSLQSGPAFEIAAKRGHMGIIKLLLNQSRSSQERAHQLGTALAKAAENGQEAIVRLLLLEYETTQ